MNSKKTANISTEKKVNPCGMQLDITAAIALRMGRMLDDMISHLEHIEQEDDRNFALAWSQLFTMYGKALLAESYMPPSYFGDYVVEVAAHAGASNR